MKITSTKYSKYKIFIAAISILACSQLLTVSSASAQIDFYYGKNTKGFRVGGGPAVTTLFTHYSSYPFNFAFMGDVDYAFNPFFSVGLNAQTGKLVGTDNNNQFYLQTSSDSYFFYNLNVKMGLGLIKDFAPKNRFQDALKRLYVGLGYGNISTSNVITTSTNPKIQSSTVYQETDNTFQNLNSAHPTAPKLSSSLPIYTLDIGTYIDMPGLWGTDKVELCPNYQFNYSSQPYLDGFKTSAKDSGVGIFIITSLTLRYKF